MLEVYMQKAMCQYQCESSNHVTVFKTALSLEIVMAMIQANFEAEWIWITQVTLCLIYFILFF